jgi:hypothetical protein
VVTINAAMVHFTRAVRELGRRHAERVPDGETGTSLVELAASLAGLAVLASVVLSVFLGVTRVDKLHADDDVALEQVREARQRMALDVREARRFTNAAASTFSVWVDADWDGATGTSEVVTWSITPDGDLVRSVGTESAVEASGLSYLYSGFGYDEISPFLISRMGIHLVVPVEDGVGGERILDTEITLRNVP